MEKPGKKRGRYTPRGKGYTPRRRGAGAVAAPMPAVPAAAGPVGEPDSVATLASRPVHFDVPPAAKRLGFDPRQSVAVPIALTVAALAVMHHFPLKTLQQQDLVPAIAATQAATAPAIAMDVTRIALAGAETIEPLANSIDAAGAVRDQLPADVARLPVQEVMVRDVGHLGAVPLVRACEVQDAPPVPAELKSVPPELFGGELAAAAEAQTREFVVYDDKYREIRYPGGDVATLYGVCTDVVVRAYRALGIDLQRLVHESQIGSGDTNISHRRVEALRRFFKKVGASVPTTDFAEDYLAGDIVTYHRPQNAGSNEHIAIVSNVTGPSGQPMIVHNRGFGPQVEDALFVNEITGHFRYTGPGAGIAAVEQTRSNVKASNVTKRAALRASKRMRNSGIRQIRRAAALKAAGGSSSGKSQPKL